LRINRDPTRKAVIELVVRGEHVSLVPVVGQEIRSGEGRRRSGRRTWME